MTTPIDTDPLEGDTKPLVLDLLHKYITYSEGFNAYIIEELDMVKLCDDISALIKTREHKAESKGYDKGYEDGEKAKPPKLVDAIQFRQEQYGWNDTKMATMLDIPKSHYSEFKHGKRGLPINSIRKAYAIGIPANVLLQDDIEARYPLRRVI